MLSLPRHSDVEVRCVGAQSRDDRPVILNEIDVDAKGVSSHCTADAVVSVQFSCIDRFALASFGGSAECNRLQ